MKKTGMSNMYHPWTEKDDTYLKNHYPTTNNKNIAKALGRSEFTITQRAWKLKLKKAKMFEWDDENTQKMLELRKTHSTKQVSEIMGIGEKKIRNRLHYLNLIGYEQKQFKPGKNRWLNILGAINE